MDLWVQSSLNIWNTNSGLGSLKFEIYIEIPFKQMKIELYIEHFEMIIS